MMSRQYKLLVFLIIAPFLYHSCAVNPVTGKKEFMLLSKSNELAMGKQSDQQIVNYMGLYEDPQLQQFIKTKGEEMVDISHRSELDYEFKIVDSPVVNAFAVPGGYVYFTRGIMAHFNNEAEFAGVLGHEIGHIAARHSAQQYSKSMAAQVGLVAGSILSEDFRQYAGLAQQGLQILFLKFGRDDERQSDKLGVEYSTKIGYDAEEMAGFFSTLSRLGASSGASEVPTFLSTHPDPENRYQKVQEMAEKWQNKLNTNNLDVNRDSYLKMIDGLVYGEDPRQGYIEDGRFYHPELKFQFTIPSGWNLQNSPQQVQMAPSNGAALLALQAAQGNDLNAAAEAFLANNQLNLVQSEQTSLNGYDALALVASQTQQEGSIQLLGYFIQDNNLIYLFFGISNAADFDVYATTFESAIGSFAKLTDPSKLDKQPEQISIKEVKASGTLREALKSYDMPDRRLEELAILNGMELANRVQRGTLIKTIQE